MYAMLLLLQMLTLLTGVSHANPLDPILNAVYGLLPPSTNATLPNSDPFYISPVPNLADFNPGQIVRYRRAPSAVILFTDLLPIRVQDAWQIAYRTTDATDNPILAVTTVLIPENADSTKLLSYQAAYDTADNDCSTSYILQSGRTFTSSELLLIGAALNLGWIVTTPDYETVDAQFTVGPTAGRATLDGVRAVLNSAQFTNVSSDAKYSMWGYSGGSIASEWAAEMNADYAPELEFTAVAIGGVVPNVTSVMQTINGGLYVDLVPTGVMGITRAYPAFASYMQEHLVPSKAATFESVKDCSNASSFAFQNMFTYFNNGAALMSDPITVETLTTSGQMGTHGRPMSRTPMYVYKAVEDDVSPVADTDNLIAEYCHDSDLNIEYHRNLAGIHVTEAVTGAPQALAWLKDRMDGVPLNQTGCVTRDVLIETTDVGGLDIFGDMLAMLVKTVLQQGVGPDFLLGPRYS